MPVIKIEVNVDEELYNRAVKAGLDVEKTLQGFIGEDGEGMEYLEEQIEDAIEEGS